MEEVKQWLKSLSLEKYANKFEENEYDNMDIISSLEESDVTEMIKIVGCKAGGAIKIKSFLKRKSVNIKDSKEKEVLISDSEECRRELIEAKEEAVETKEFNSLRETKLIQFESTNIGIVWSGNRIVEVKPNSQASRLGVCVGWICVEINGIAQRNDTDSLVEAIKAAKQNVYTFRILFNIQENDHYGEIEPMENTDKFISLKEKSDQSVYGTTYTYGKVINLLKKYDKRMQLIEDRNKSKGFGKDFEGCWARICIIMTLTYFVLGLYMMFVNINRPWINAIVPTIGFQLSTLSLKCAKNRYVDFQFKSLRKNPFLRTYM